jgi:hypothetical protein
MNITIETSITDLKSFLNNKISVGIVIENFASFENIDFQIVPRSDVLADDVFKQQQSLHNNNNNNAVAAGAQGRGSKQDILQNNTEVFPRAVSHRLVIRRFHIPLVDEPRATLSSRTR